MSEEQTVYIVDDDEGIREGLSLLLDTVAQQHKVYSSAQEFLDQYHPSISGCIVLDIRMPRMSGLELQEKLLELETTLPIIFITGHGDVPMAVEAMRRRCSGLYPQTFQRTGFARSDQRGSGPGQR